MEGKVQKSAKSRKIKDIRQEHSVILERERLTESDDKAE